jgi:hypothetical protein
MFLCCDRVGEETIYTEKVEKLTQFVGTSCVVKLNPNQVVMKLGKKQEGYLMVETELG